MLSGKALSLGPPFRVCGSKYMGFPHKPAQNPYKPVLKQADSRLTGRLALAIMHQRFAKL